MLEMLGLVELDPTNRALYQGEARRWARHEKEWQERTEPRRQSLFQDYEEKKHQEVEREAKRLQLILEKRRRRGKH